MARGILELLSSCRSNTLAVADRYRALDYRALTAEVSAFARESGCGWGTRAGLVALPDVASWVRLLGLLEAGATVFVAPHGLLQGPGAAVAASCRIERWFPGGDGAVSRSLAVPADTGAAPDVVLFTSGTTGAAKAAAHTWESLSACVRRDNQGLSSARWLLGYGLASFAGLQVALHALLNGGALILTDGEPSAQARLGQELAASHLSATPTFFRLLLATTPSFILAGWSPRQISIGGERVDQGVLDRLSAVFPGARLTHIYASTEMGVCFSVHDGRAGFPTAMLRSSATPAWLDIVDGELVVRSPHRMAGYVAGAGAAGMSGEWRTGDLVRIEGDRVQFVGRRNASINVGGRKVHPEEVEDVLRMVPGVVDVHVYGRASALVGELVAADVTPEPDVEHGEIKRRISALANERLAPHQRPRIVRLTATLATGSSGKKERGRAWNA